ETVRDVCTETSLVELAPLAASLGAALDDLVETTRVLTTEAARDPRRALANASAYLEMTSRVVVGWLWLRMAVVASRALGAAEGFDSEFYSGQLLTARYWIAW